MIDLRNDYEIKSQNGSIPVVLENKQLEAGYIIFNESEFSHWRRLLNQWIENIKKICKETKINPYKNNEMCNTGLLEAAAWMIGGIAMSEYPERLIINRWGRLDLWMKLPEFEKIELIEAKHTTHLKLPKRNGELDKYDYSSLKQDLEKRAKMINPHQAKRMAVLIFLTLNFDYFNWNNIKDIEDKIRHLLKIVTGSEPYEDGYIQNDWNLTAWCFPEEMRNDNPYPGIIMSVKTM